MSQFEEFDAQLLEVHRVAAELDVIAELDKSLAAQSDRSLLYQRNHPESTFYPGLFH